jgi:hypothetical protein
MFKIDAQPIKPVPPMMGENGNSQAQQILEQQNAGFIVLGRLQSIYQDINAAS